MDGLKGLVLPDDAENPVRASLEVRKTIEAIRRNPKERKRLWDIARAIVRNAGGIRRWNVDVAGGRAFFGKELIDDLVHEATLRILDGRRAWDMQKHPDFLVYFGGVVGSLWTAFAKAEKRRKDSEATLSKEEVFDWRTRRPRTPLELCIEKEEHEEFLAMQAAFLDEFKKEAKKGDDRALDFLALTQDGMFDPAEQARHLGITMDEIYTLRARVRRVTDRFIADWRKQRKRES